MDTMLNATKRTAELKLIGGDLALDFTNTAGWRGEPMIKGVLGDYVDLVAWADHVGALDQRQIRSLLRQAGAKRTRAQAAYRQAIALREALHRTFGALAAGRSVEPIDLALINAVVREAHQHLRLHPDGDCLSWRWHDIDKALELPIWMVARSAVELLTSDKLSRVRECEGDKCDWLFLDASKNKSRRWCDMANCGNRAKARRNYAKRREAGRSSKDIKPSSD